MAAERLRRVQELFEAALAKPADERDQFLDGACGNDKRLRADVASLLSHDSQVDGEFMRAPGLGLERCGADDEQAERPADPTESVAIRSSAQDSSSTVPAIPDYEVICFIGKGGFGDVWLARQRLTSVFYAVKVIARDKVGKVELDGIREFKQRAAGHPNLINLEHVGETEDCLYYIMELADDARGSGVRSPENYEAMTLAERIKRSGALSAEAAVQIVGQILDGLQHLHEAGLLHRDVKPANVLCRDGRWMLGDMGLVTSHSHAEVRAGTPLYAPPEGVKDRSGDLYCLGRLLVELITGATPAEAFYSDRICAADDVPLVKRAVDVATRACHPTPSQRYQSAGAMRGALLPAKRSSGRGRLIKGAFLGLIAAAVIVICGFAIQSRLPSPPPTSSSAPMLSESLLEVYFKPNQEDDGHYFKLDERNVPLRTGSVIQIHAELATPSFPYLFYISGHEAPKMLYPEKNSPPGRITVLDNPPNVANPRDQEWHTLTPPEGTEMFLLLVADDPIADIGALLKELVEVRPPRLEPYSILVGDAENPVLRWDNSRGLEPASVVSPKGVLQDCGAEWRSQFRDVRLLAFPHANPDTHVKGD